MNKYLFDKLPCGCEVTAYEIGNDTVRATILNYGGIIQKLLYRGTDIIGGYDRLRATASLTAIRARSSAVTQTVSAADALR